MLANTGTSVDAPFHRFESGADIAGLSLARLAARPGMLFDATTSGRRIGSELFGPAGLEGVAVLVRTGWDRHRHTPRYAEGHPFLTRAAVGRFISSGAALVGIDSVNIDDTADLTRPAHTLLLEAGIPIVENPCNLDALPASGFSFHAVPAPVRGMGSFPVCAHALIP